MKPVYMDVEPAILQWVLDKASGQLDKETIDLIHAWMDGSEKPRYSLVKAISKKTYIPLGYFFLKEPPSEDYDLLKYRTRKGADASNLSREMLDTIAEMERVHDWMAEYMRYSNYDGLSFVANANDSESAEKIAGDIREYLGLKGDWASDYNGFYNTFGHFRRLLDKCGVVVMTSGVACGNNQRGLTLEEFRALTIADKVSSLIFINTKDSKNSRLFSLLSGTAHIWLGKSGLLDWDVSITAKDRERNLDGTEKFCNEIASDLILPQDVFMNEWSELHLDSPGKIERIANRYKCGKILVARKALDNKKIDDSVYGGVVDSAIVNYNKETNTKHRGGNASNTVHSRLSACFVNALCDSVYTGRTSYSEAFSLTHTTYKSFFNAVGTFDSNEINTEIFERLRGKNV